LAPAELLNVPLGNVASDLGRRGLVVFDPPKGAPVITARKVKDPLADFP